MLNGGLSLYRANRFIYVTRCVDCLVSANEKGYRFKQGHRDGNSKVPLTQPSKPKC